MRSLRQQTARDKLERKKVHSSLHSLPSTKSRNKLAASQQIKRKNAIRQTQRRKQKHDFEERKDYDENQDYDSTDSLEQLLDNNFIPIQNRSKSSMNPKYPKHVTPKKNIGGAAGGRRAKAMAFMASTAKKQNKYKHNKLQDKKKFKQICDRLNTPAHARKIIPPSPAIMSLCNNKLNIKYAPCTPKKLDVLKDVATPCTPTPVKLMRSLNVRTPKNTKAPNRSSRYDCSPEKINLKHSSWKDIDYDRDTKNKKKKHVSELQRLRIITRPLPLPIKWTVLMQKFNALESTMSMYMRKNSFYVHYSQIQHSAQKITKKKFDKRDIQQIISAVPDFYHLQWTAILNCNTGKKELKLTLTALDYNLEAETKNDVKKNRLRDIGIRFMKISKLKEREELFRIRLIQYIAHHHEQWLSDNEMLEFDPLETGKWHKRFNLEEVPNIEFSPLPLRPRKDDDEIAKMIKDQEEKLNEIMDATEANDVDIPAHLKGLSPTFIAKIRAKKKNKIVTAKKLKSKAEIEADEEQFRLQQLPYLVGLMRGIYVSSKKSSMSCTDLIALIKKRHRNIHYMGPEIWKQLQLLDSLESKFFKIRQGPMVKVAKLNKRISTKDVLQEIKSKTKY